MEIRFLLASPDGDLLLSEHDLQVPFMIAPDRKHPFLTLGDYFRVLESLLCKIPRADLATLCNTITGSPTNLEELSQIDISSQKHGALYHISRITLVTKTQSIALAATTAITDTARQFLRHEFGLLQSLNDTSTVCYLPKIYRYETTSCCKQEGREEFSCMLGEWLSDYHEWHLTDSTENRTQKICLWDTEQGNINLSESAGYEIIKQAAVILTHYYDPASGRMLWPWHHAAGDFIVRCQNSAIDVKLITARNYLPIFHLVDGETSTFTTLIGFLLLTTLRLRLDKLNGTGKTVWINTYALSAAVVGFFESLQKHEASGGVEPGFTWEFLELLQYLDADDLIQMSEMVVEYFTGDDDDLALVQEHLAAHCHTLVEVLKTMETGQVKESPGDAVRSPETTE